MLKVTLFIKVILDAIAAFGFALGPHRNVPMAIMFAGFALADVGAMAAA